MSQDSLNIQSFVRDHDKIKHAALLRQAGLRRDRSQVPALIRELENVSDDLHLYTVLHSLAQIGDVSALPTMDALLKRPGWDIQDYCFAKAEKVADPDQKASVRLQEFLAALGMDAAGINAAVARNVKEARGTLHPTIGLGTYALRGLADMIYRHRDMALAATARAIGINFDAEPGAKYKVQLAPLSSQERVDWLVTALSNKQALQKEDFFLIQLAADEGHLASHAAAEKLKEMDQHRGEDEQLGKRFHAKFNAMFRILSCIDDPAQEPIVRRFLNDPNQWISYYAKQNYEEIKNGVAGQWRIGY